MTGMEQWGCTNMNRFLNDENGGITALNLQLFVASLILGGLAVDYGNAMANRTHLQVAADSAAHAAILTRELNGAEDAKARAIELASASMPAPSFGSVLSQEDIMFGDWDRDAELFTADSNSRNAVLVSTKRHAANGNGVATYLLGLAGLANWDVTSGTVYETYYPACFREGFVAQDRVEVQSNSYYTNGFCIHSQSHVKLSSNNVFEPGVVISMPDTADVELPASGFKTNSGAQEALRSGSYRLRILQRIDSILQGIEDPYHTDYGIMSSSATEYYRQYISNAGVVRLNYRKDAEPGTFTENAIHDVTCKKDKMNYSLNPGSELKNAVLFTNCRLQIKAGAVIENAVIFSNNAESTAVTGSAGVVIGRDDNCLPGGDVQIVSHGSVSFPSDASIFGSQIIAAQDISLTARADGLEGVSLVAGGMIDVTSNGGYGFCGSGMENSYEAAYFRLAK
ncbi:hypothetical protein DEA8626_02326 [Defluviimonas aquaemixtae]|uniref:Uncharacterized protein n=1 Tax=Albidovulum aquaemixtae TaxID=1542388 RepID=A0A2R8B874_9RHOB|nr:pilus assembly protein TadG-related protein [Defluviimonas aquaemixtae]SPH18782.1 hypothetical protein DEA8626_02326 [Defluviimonas aquaemixtae]